MLCSDEEYRIHELSVDMSRLQDIVQKQREEMRVLEHDATQKTAELEVVGSCCLMHSFCISGVWRCIKKG